MAEIQKMSGRVLLVDDDPDIRRDYARLLRSLGLEVETAIDGRDAIDKLGVTSFNLVLSDISMPRLKGTDFLRAIRRADLDVPVILMTGSPGLDTAIEAVEHGALRYLAKPVSLVELAEVVRRAISMHELACLKREALEVVGAEGRQLGDRASLQVRFESALEQLWMAFQPIVSWPARTTPAYEALMRSSEPSLKSPLDLLDAAVRLDRMHDLGRKVRASVATAAPIAPADVLLFVNLHASDLNDPELLSADAPLSAIASRVVLEITERSSLDGVQDLTSKIEALRQLGFQIAVDDLGAGYAGLSSFSQLEPEYVKLDMSLIRGVDTSVRRRSIVRALARLCKYDLQIGVICEGVETPEERDTLENEGCELLQGYLFARPQADFPAATWDPP